MNGISAIQEGMQWAHELLEMVMADVTSEQANWQPPGIANPLGAIYAHALFAEDGAVNGLFRGGAPLFASTWASKTGLENPQMQLSQEWSRALRADLPALKAYAQAVYTTTGEYLASLTDADLATEVDLSQIGFDKRPLSWCLNALVISHVNNMAGEISCLKGLQGAKGYPF